MKWPISWNDVKKALEENQLAHVDTKKILVFPEKEYEFTEVSGMPSPCLSLDTPLDIAAGDVVSVTFDGIEYSLKAANISGGVALGNLAFAEIPDLDTGEPFLYFAQDASGMRAIFVETAGVHTVSIIKIEETVYPIDPKFIPQSALGVFLIDLADIGVEIDEVPVECNFTISMNKMMELQAAHNAHKLFLCYWEKEDENGVKKVYTARPGMAYSSDSLMTITFDVSTLGFEYVLTISDLEGTLTITNKTST